MSASVCCCLSFLRLNLSVPWFCFICNFFMLHLDLVSLSRFYKHQHLFFSIITFHYLSGFRSWGLSVHWGRVCYVILLYPCCPDSTTQDNDACQKQHNHTSLLAPLFLFSTSKLHESTATALWMNHVWTKITKLAPITKWFSCLVIIIRVCQKPALLDLAAFLSGISLILL